MNFRLKTLPDKHTEAMLKDNRLSSYLFSTLRLPHLEHLAVPQLPPGGLDGTAGLHIARPADDLGIIPEKLKEENTNDKLMSEGGTENRS